VPLHCGGQRLGFLKLFRRSQERWTTRDVTIAEMIGATVSLTLASERLLLQARQQSSDQGALARIAQVAITQGEPRDLLQRVADEIRSLLPFPCVDIELWSPDQDRCEIVAHSAVPGWPAPTEGVVFYRLSDWPVNLRVLREMWRVTLDANDDLIAVEQTYLARRGLAELHFLPLMYGERCLGAIVLHAQERISFDDRLNALISEAAAITALAAHAARSLRETQWERRAQAWQLRVNQALLNDAPFVTVLDEALAAFVDMTGVTAAVLSIDHPQLQESSVRRVAVSGTVLLSVAERWNTRRWPVVMEAVHSYQLQLMRINDQSVDSDSVLQLRRDGQEWVLAVPLLHDNQLFGVLVLVYPAGFAATSELLSFIRMMARQISLVASDHTMRDEQLLAARRASTMLKVTQAAIAGSDLETLLRVIATACLELDSVDACEIEQYDPVARTITNDTIVFGSDWRHAYQPGKSHSIDDWPLFRDAIEARAPRAFLVTDPDVNDHEAELLRHIGVRSVMVVPLSMGDEVLGVMTLYRVAPIPFSSRTLALAGELAAQASLALGRARLFDALLTRADTDGVTGLLNHRAILERIDRTLQIASASGEPVSLMLIDLDNFKLLNDVNGHLTGDRYLREMAQLIQETVGDRGEVARYGGDEFLVLLRNVEFEACNALAQCVFARSRETGFDMSGYRVPFQFSIGTASAPAHGSTRDQLIRIADRAMYEAKEHGGGRLGQIGGTEEVLPLSTFTALAGLVQAVDRKDHYTRVHSDRVTAIAVRFATWLGRSEADIEALYIAGQLHDVGKIAVPDSILRRPGRLSADEQERLRQHVIFSELMIKDVPNLHLVISAVSAHHERWDGRGYPRGLAGEEIPNLGRILAIADAMAAMTQDRPYTKARTMDDALAEMAANSGTQFDPELLAAFLRFAETGALLDDQPVPPPHSLTGMPSAGPD
jgi:diguanylate cyclase (GGDEF)-like protein